MMRKFFSTLLLGLACAAAVAADHIKVHYYPGWKRQPDLSIPWDKIKPSPEREPALGWYPEGEVGGCPTAVDGAKRH
jgi:hypothetical protein